jgi:hypothetical protein
LHAQSSNGIKVAALVLCQINRAFSWKGQRIYCIFDRNPTPPRDKPPARVVFLHKLHALGIDYAQMMKIIWQRINLHFTCSSRPFVPRSQHKLNFSGRNRGKLRLRDVVYDPDFIN